MSSDSRERDERDLLRRYFEVDPVTGTQLGIPGQHDGCLPPAENDARGTLLAALSRQCREFVERHSQTDPDTAIDCELATSGVRRIEILTSALRAHERNPDWYVDVAMAAVYSLLMRTDMPAEERAVHMSGRLAAIPAHLQAGRNQLRKPPSVLVETALGNIGGALEFCRDSLGAFIESVAVRPLRIELERHRDRCVEALAGFGEHVEAQRATAGSDFAVGQDAFEALLSASLVPLRAGPLSDLGEATALAIERELAECSPGKEWWVTLEDLRSHHPAGDALLDDYRRMVEDCRRFVEERKLVTVPPDAMETVSTPPFARANLAFAAYIPAPPFGNGAAAQFWVTPPTDDSSLASHHLGRITVAAVHETYPGHHVQFSHALRTRSPLRHIFGSNVFIEGWGLYSEELMMRSGFQEGHPLFALLLMSQLRDQLWRALRIVIDVGLHCGGMSSEEAVDLLVDRHVLDRASAASEVMYYCSAPTQPMSYMVGKLLIDSLVEKCRRSGEERFRSTAGIHDELLSHGPLPLPLLERAMRIDTANAH